MKKKTKLSSVLAKDDASRYLASLSPQERRPQTVLNKSLPSPDSFSEEERKVAEKISSTSESFTVRDLLEPL